MKNKFLITVSSYIFCNSLFADLIQEPVIQISNEAIIHASFIVLSSIVAILSLLTIFCVGIYGLYRKKTYWTLLLRSTIIFITSSVIFCIGVNLLKTRPLFEQKAHPIKPHPIEPKPFYGPTDPMHEN